MCFWKLRSAFMIAPDRRFYYLDWQPWAGDDQPFRNPAGQFVQQSLGVAVNASDGHHDIHAHAHDIQVAMLWQGTEKEGKQLSFFTLYSSKWPHCEVSDGATTHVQWDFVLSRFQLQLLVLVFEGKHFDGRQVVEAALPQVVLLVHVDENLSSVWLFFCRPVGQRRGPALHVGGVGLATAHLQLHISSDIQPQVNMCNIVKKIYKVANLLAEETARWGLWNYTGWWFCGPNQDSHLWSPAWTHWKTSGKICIYLQNDSHTHLYIHTYIFICIFLAFCRHQIKNFIFSFLFLNKHMTISALTLQNKPLVFSLPLGGWCLHRRKGKQGCHLTSCC